MIFVVEGPTAAGKTTWCDQHATAVVAEYTPTGREPNGSDLPAQASFWTNVNRSRWALALAEKERAGVVVCDSDPLKLHYSWSLAQIGAVPRARFDHELTKVRAAFTKGVLGFADVVLVSIPPVEALRARRDADPLRRRRCFDLHARLGEPLRGWYKTVDALDPGRVLFQLPADGIPSRLPPASSGPLRPRTPGRADLLPAGPLSNG